MDSHQFIIQIVTISPKKKLYLGAFLIDGEKLMKIFKKIPVPRLFSIYIEQIQKFPLLEKKSVQKSIQKSYQYN